MNGKGNADPNVDVTQDLAQASGVTVESATADDEAVSLDPDEQPAAVASPSVARGDRRLQELSRSNRELRERLEQESLARARLEGRLEAARPAAEEEPADEVERKVRQLERGQQETVRKLTAFEQDAQQRAAETARQQAQRAALTGLKFRNREDLAFALGQVDLFLRANPRATPEEAREHAEHLHQRFGLRDAAKAEKKEAAAAATARPTAASIAAPTGREQSKSMAERLEAARTAGAAILEARRGR